MKNILVGTTAEGRRVLVKAKITKGVLRIIGEALKGYEYNGGQIINYLRDVRTFSKGWNAEKRDKFAEVWERWHLNNLRAGCEHQRAEEWDKRPIDPSLPLDAYGKFNGCEVETWNMLGWVTRKQHPEGLLSHPCSVCGYKYGSAWLFEPLPQEVVDFINSLDG